IAQGILAYSPADQTEVVLSSGERGLTRFANSAIHQHVLEDHIHVSVRAVVGKKIGVASSNKVDKISLKRVVERAIQIAKLQKEDPHFHSLPTPNAYERVNAYSEKTTQITPIEKAKQVKRLITLAEDASLIASGSFETATSELAIANSLGVWAYHPSTSASFSTVLLGESGTGFASHLGIDVETIHVDTIAQKAIAKAKASAKPQDLPAGEYEVVLEPPAVNEMLLFFSYLGPNARVVHENASFLTGRLETKVLSPQVTILDDPFDVRGVPMPFDFEGVPKKKLTLIEKGVARKIAYDSYHAHKHHMENTGHALPAPNIMGPMPGHLIILPGQKTVEEMVKNVKRGLLVTRFWYVRSIHFKLLNITGMTRDGTFLIENGEIVAPVKNMRFTESIPEALSDVCSIGKTLSVEPSWVGANLVPALHIGHFMFTGQTDF
ncbi:MAG TPA: TldD/PmbA family protein, partial [Patescibacteria group bacterium]|nr:TldD/PmbA family protein [Patescibacteria group bacterium]